ncbi:phospholipase D-like domain-containing protein [Xanthobacter sp. KR7-65]|uniref:phospholipase D-like domain-containing protein n=1 Tax=Xanthobacter sp. KR7-65 TaxID=3156612 RepID=UPI0032B5C9B2
MLIDGCEYFSELEAALRRAVRSIVIVGWDFDGGVRLRPQGGAGWDLGPLLRRLVEARPELEVRILIWSSAVLHGPSSPQELLFGSAWQDHPRISLRLDTTHPIYASHHQKIVCIDSALAFVGGMDITVDRWDTPEHVVDDPRRVCPNGKSYGPVHDVMLMLDGPAAGAVCALASKRWKAATGEEMPAAPGDVEPWPAHRTADFTGVRVGLARSLPAWAARRRIKEAPRLIEDVLRSARRSLYIEAQYLTADHIGHILTERLKAPEGPEIVAVVSDVTHSFLERVIMGANRNRMIRRLRRADRHGRLRIYHPMAPGPDGGCPILVHSKLMIADDQLLRIGSSNLNNRSVGLDTELEVVIEAAGADDREAITRLRDRLLGEHLGVPAERLAEVVAETGSLIAAVEQLNVGERRLEPFRAMTKPGALDPIIGSSLLDPTEPFSWAGLWNGLWPKRPDQT